MQVGIYYLPIMPFLMVLLVLLLRFTAPCMAEMKQNNNNNHNIGVNAGLQDATAVIGKLFRYTIPKDTFYGNVAFYEVTEAGSTTLQKWLVWYPERSELVGIPREDDSGPNYVQVTAVEAAINPRTNVKDQLNYTGTSGRRGGGKAKDVFSIQVSDEIRLPAGKGQLPLPLEERISCGGEHDGPSSSSTTMTLLLAADLDNLTTVDRLELVERVAGTFDKKTDAMRLLANTDESYTTLKRIMLLASAPPPSPPTNNNNVVVTWLISCDSSNALTPETNDALKLLLDQHKNDEPDVFEKKFGYPLVSWFISSVTYEGQKRRRRQAYPSYVASNSRYGQSTQAYDVTVPSVPTRSPTVPPARSTPTIRIRPTGFVTSSGFDWSAVPSTSSRRTTSSSSSSKTSPSSSRSSSSRSTPSSSSTSRLMTGTTAPSVPVITWKPDDSKPTLKNSLLTRYCQQNILCTIPIPSNTFYDAEDGDTSKLVLRLDALGDDVKRQPSWLRLDDARQILIGLPLRAGNFLFRLTATDSGNRQESDAFSVEVKEDTVNEKDLTHRVSIHFAVPDEKNFTTDVKSRIFLIQKLAQYYADSSSAEKIRVNSLRSNSEEESGLFVLSWSNISLPVNTCPKNELRVITNRLLRDDGSTVRMQFKRFMEPQFLIRRVNIEYGGVCVDRAAETVPFRPLSPTSSTTTNISSSTSPAPAKGDDDFFISTILPAIIIAVFLIVAALVACILYRKNRRHKKGGRAESKSEFVSKGTPVIFPDEVEFDKESTAATPMLLKDEKPPLQPLEFVGGAGLNGQGGNGNGNGAGNAAHTTTALRSPLSAKSPPHSTGGGGGPGRALGKTQVSEAETELWQRPLLQDMDENPLYRPPPAFEPAGVKENRSPRPKHASPQQRDPPPYVPP